MKFERRTLVGAVALLGLSCARSSADSEAPSERRAPPASSVAARVVSSEPVAVEVGGASAVLPRGVTSFGAATSGGSLFVLGGYFGTPHEYSEAGQTGELLRMDLRTHAWTRLGEVAKVQSVALVAHGQRLIRIGGMQAHNAAGTPADLHSLDTVESFDIATSTWSPLPSLPEPRSSHDAVVIGDAVWVVGGWSLQGQSKTWHTTILRLDLNDLEAGWSSIDAPFERRAVAAATVDGRVVVMGGLDRGRAMSSEVDVYDPATERWSKGPAFAGPGFGMAGFGHEGAVVATGMDGVVRRWAPSDGAWTQISTLAYPRFFHRIVPAEDGDLLVLGGIRGMRSGRRVKPIERIAVGPDSGRTRWLAYALPSPMSSKNRQGVARHDDELFFFGGNKSLGQHDFGPEFFTDEGHVLDLSTLTWRTAAALPHPRQSMSTFVTSWGQIISVGGFGHDGEVARSHPEVHAYHPGKDEWSQVGSLPGQGRTQFGLAVREAEVMLLGGLDYDPRRPEKERFRHEQGLLQAPLRPSGMDFVLADVELRQPRRAFAGALLDDRYYLVGGMREGFSLVDDCEAYDFSTESWHEIACPAHTRLSGKMVGMEGRLYLAAGSSRTGADGMLEPDSSLEAYDPKTDRWTTLVEALPIEPKHLSMSTYGDRLLLVSTHNDDGVVHVMLVDPST